MAWCHVAAKHHPSPNWPIFKSLPHYWATISMLDTGLIGASGISGFEIWHICLIYGNHSFLLLDPLGPLIFFTRETHICCEDSWLSLPELASLCQAATRPLPKAMTGPESAPTIWNTLSLSYLLFVFYLPVIDILHDLSFIIFSLTVFNTLRPRLSSFCFTETVFNTFSCMGIGLFSFLFNWNFSQDVQ